MTDKLDLTKKQTVLVVDNDPENLTFVSTVLSGMYKVKGASSGENALKIALLDTQPDLILLDTLLQDLDGMKS